MSSSTKLSSLAIACPGQGIVARGCLHHLQQHKSLFDDVLDTVDSALGEHFCRNLLDAPPQAPDIWSLSTANAQPAIVASTFVLSKLMKRKYGVSLASDSRVSYILGHSLGEYTALLLGGVLTLEQAVQVVRKRGLLMEKLIKGNTYEMRVLLFKPASYETVYQTCLARGVLACANNSTQISISGEPAELDGAVADINSARKTVLRSVTLPVTVPFHNKVLRSIEPRLSKLVAGHRASSKPIISNITGDVSSATPYLETVSANSAPVQWKKSMELLESKGVGGVVNLGPGNALDAINAKYKLQNFALKDCGDMEKLAEALAVS